MTTPGVTDILVNGTDTVWIDRGNGLETTDIEIGDPDAVRRLAVRLAGLADRRLDEASPYVDGLLPGGIRLHAVLPPLVDSAAHISLRIPRADVVSLERLVALGSMPPEWADILRAIVAARCSFVVSGGTGTGKTTILASLLAQARPDERILVVEDVRELAVHHPHVVRMQARPANVEGAGAVDMVALVRQSLRMRPDRLVVGEVRGAEVREMLTALNTGHEGGSGTIHANSAHDVITRFEALGALAGMTPAAVRAQLGSALSVVIHLRRTPTHRIVESIGLLHTENDELHVR
ncbi:TadA family conjugal transfer-associated ATPase, partial [Dermatophilus congolensis]